MKIVDIENPETLLVVVDVQEKLVRAMPDFESTRHTIITALRLARTLGMKTLVTEQYPKGLGRTIAPIRQEIPPDSAEMEKTTFSCWDSAVFREEVARSGTNLMLIVGIEAHICIQQTALDTAYRGIHCVVPADAVCSRKKVDCERACALMNNKGVTVTTLEAFAFDWLGDSVHPGFKSVAKLFHE